MGMRKIGIVATLAAALMMVGAGCGGSDPNEAETPANAPTVSTIAVAIRSPAPEFVIAVDIGIIPATSRSVVHEIAR